MAGVRSAVGSDPAPPSCTRNGAGSARPPAPGPPMRAPGPPAPKWATYSATTASLTSSTQRSWRETARARHRLGTARLVPLAQPRLVGDQIPAVGGQRVGAAALFYRQPAEQLFAGQAEGQVRPGTAGQPPHFSYEIAAWASSSPTIVLASVISPERTSSPTPANGKRSTVMCCSSIPWRSSGTGGGRGPGSTTIPRRKTRGNCRSDRSAPGGPLPGPSPRPVPVRPSAPVAPPSRRACPPGPPAARMSSGARYWRTRTTSSVRLVHRHHDHGTGMVHDVPLEALAAGAFERPRPRCRACGCGRRGVRRPCGT